MQASRADIEEGMACQREHPAWERDRNKPTSVAGVAVSTPITNPRRFAHLAALEKQPACVATGGQRRTEE
tara:strand:+ start:713 stop:922 length:210 start_codon:yes stop_codon:yes gene_type:complete